VTQNDAVELLEQGKETHSQRHQLLLQTHQSEQVVACKVTSAFDFTLGKIGTGRVSEGMFASDEAVVDQVGDDFVLLFEFALGSDEHERSALVLHSGFDKIVEF